MVLDSPPPESPLFPASAAIGEGLGASEVAQRTWVDSDVGLVPIGSIIAWAKDLDAGIPALQDNFVECNGQVLSDGDSPINGATIPNLNGTGIGTEHFLRGQTTSGGAGGSETHTHVLDVQIADTGGDGTYAMVGANSGATSTLPTYYEVVWVMRVK